VLTLVLILLAPAAIIAGVVRELQEDRRVTIQTVFCGLSLYLLLGLAFALLFGAVQDLGSQPFFASNEEGTSNDFLYFSLATLTTVGYGDLVAASDLGRAIAVSEALIGQIYLVTVLAVIVSNVRRRPP
jgi:Ion channel